MKLKTNGILFLFCFFHGKQLLKYRGTSKCKFSLSLVFICRENPRRSGILLFPDLPRFCRLMKTRNRRYPRSSGMNGDKSGESGAFLFSRRVPDFCDGRRSFPTNENSNLYRRGHRRPSASVGDGFRSLPIPKIAGLQSPITNKHAVSRKSGTDLWRMSDISAKSGMVGKK